MHWKARQGTGMWRQRNLPYIDNQERIFSGGDFKLWPKGCQRCGWAGGENFPCLGLKKLREDQRSWSPEPQKGDGSPVSLCCLNISPTDLGGLKTRLGIAVMLEAVWSGGPHSGKRYWFLMDHVSNRLVWTSLCGQSIWDCEVEAVMSCEALLQALLHFHQSSIGQRQS